MSILDSKTIVTPGSGDYRWLRSNFGRGAQLSATVDVNLLVAGTHYDAKTGIVPAGLPLGKVTATGNYGPYDPTATDGRDVLEGFMSAPEQLEGDAFTGITTTELYVSYLWIAAVDPAYVPTAPTLNNTIKTTGVFKYVGVDYVSA